MRKLDIFKCENITFAMATLTNRTFHTKRLLEWNGLVFHWCLYNEKNITWLLGDKKFLFLCWKNISLVCCAHSWNIFQHSKKNFVSPHGHVISSINATNKLQYVKFNVVTTSTSYSLQSVPNTMNTLSSHSQEDKNNGKFRRGHPKEWLQLLTRGGYLQKVPNVVISLCIFWCFGWVVFYERQ